jgi:hypothetical protein
LASSALWWKRQRAHQSQVSEFSKVFVKSA